MRLLLNANISLGASCDVIVAVCAPLPMLLEIGPLGCLILWLEVATGS